ncbi:MAG TPA: ParA family protein [Thiotrichaceae bacterium]|nr:ParA family protein [Thiotrichaceae bacterium]
MKLRTWLDIDRIIRNKTNGLTKMPPGILDINCFYDAIEMTYASEKINEEEAKDILKEWFLDWFDQTESVIRLDIDDSTIPVEFLPGETTAHNLKNAFHPFWKEVEYLESAEINSHTIQFPPPFSDDMLMIAFHSFKGGVGRTSHLVAYLFALLEQAKAIHHDTNILVIDADLEAPGLTYWHRKEKLQPTVSIIDFLEAYHYPPTDQKSTIAFYAKELKKSYHDYGFYFMPACLEDNQLLDIRILPEHIAQSLEGTWECSQAIYQLAKAIKANYVLIDLRAGLTELASPILFDPRIERYLITTLSEQSVSGTRLALEKLSKLAPRLEEIEAGTYLDPKLIISMLKQDLKDSPIYENVFQNLVESYSVQEKNDDIHTLRLNIEETFFAEQLLYFSDWRDARKKINEDTTLMQWARQRAKEVLTPLVQKNNNSLEQVSILKAICEKYEYAESGESDDLLMTKPLKNLALNHIEDLPRVVCIGAKGAGKTFNYVQLAHFERWHHFLEKTSIDPVQGTEGTDRFIFPLLQSNTLKGKALQKIEQARKAFITHIEAASFSPSRLHDDIKRALSEQLHEEEWRAFWIEVLYQTINKTGDSQRSSQSLVDLDVYLKEKQVRVIFLFDGLEDIFSKIASDEAQQMAVKTLLDMPYRLGEIRQPNIGLIIFLRRDFLRHAIPQNQSQFENLYRAYDLSWDFDSFLKFIYWICVQSKIIDAVDTHTDKLTSKEITEFLEKLWGKKLGQDNSNEAITVNWVYAALTDFNGRLQARDIVRLLLYSAEYGLNNQNIFEYWKETRLLPPPAIRQSITHCSEKKVAETKEEYPLFKEWASKMAQISADKRKMPFSPEQLEIEPKTIEILKEIGIIYEDKEINENERFYMPEIFRTGLDFTYADRGRKRLSVLKRQALKTL